MKKSKDIEVLTSLRQEIDEIDEAMLQLFEKRMDVVLKIAGLKTANKMEILDESREEKILGKTDTIISEKMKPYATAFLKEIMSISKRLQADYFSEIDQEDQEHGSTIVGFQGLPGSFSEEALRSYFGENTRNKNYVHFEDVFLGLQAGEINYGVLPLENSFTGGIADVYDLLCGYGFSIVGEKCVKVDHNLLALPGARLEDIQEVYSHPQALQQCSKYLKTYPLWNQIPCSNTAVSAKKLKDSGSFSKAAIASARAAEIYGLTVLERGISNNPNNSTRFMIIGRNMKIASENNKISLVLTISHEPGSLHKILGHFAENKLNMMKIESRPIPDKTWEYLFYIDFEGNLKNEEVLRAVNGIKQDSTFFRLLGNYLSDQEKYTHETQ